MDNKDLPSLQSTDTDSKTNTGPVIDIEFPLASEEESFYYRVGWETIEALPGQYLDTLQKLSTILVAIIGGGMLGLRDDLMSIGFKIFLLLAFIASLAVALLGIMPLTKSNLAPEEPWTIRQHREDLIKRRSRCLVWSCLLMLVGFLIGLLGLIVRFFHQI
jgi:hypothetical protein